jgi:hydroxypyruvate isomerase
MPRFAANLSMLFGELPFLERFAAARAAGFQAVEFLFPYAHRAEELRARLEGAGLEQALFNLPPGDFEAGERGIAALPGREDEFKASLEEALVYAETLNCPRLHVMAGIPLPDTKVGKATATYQTNLAWALSQLGNLPATLLIEPINRRDMPGYFLSSLAQAESVIEEVGDPRLRLQLDWYHAQISGGDLTVNTRRYWPLVEHIQLAGVPDRHEPDEGEVNYRHLFELVDDLGYRGWIGCEYRPRRGTVEGLAWLTRLQGEPAGSLA